MRRKAIWVVVIAAGLVVCGPLARVWMDRRGEVQALQLAQKGRHIALAFYDSMVETEPSDPDLPFPYPWSGRFRTSTECFTCAMTNELIRRRLFPSDFTVPDQALRSPDLLTSEENAWCVSLDLLANAARSAPLLFSRNALFSKPVSGATLNDVSGIDEEALPGIRHLVVVWMDGSVKVLSRKEVIRVSFDPSSGLRIMSRSPYRREDLPQKFNPSGKPMKFLSP
jgi:hypothetical protein